MRFADFLAPLAGAVLVFSGAIKGSTVLPELPVDLTLAGAVLAVALLTTEVLRPGWSRSPALVAIPLLWVLFAVGLAGFEPGEYASAKVTYLFTLTFVCALAPAVTVTTELRQRILCWLLLLGGGLAAALARIAPDLDVLRAQRLAVDGSTTLGTGRAAGVALVVVCVGLSTGLLRGVVGLPLLPFLAWATIGSGTRGSLLSCVLALLGVAVLRPGKASQRVRRLVVTLAGITAVGCAAYGLAGGTFAFRRATGMAELAGASTAVRLRLFEASARLVPDSPFGIGWGGLVDHLPPASQFANGDIRYAHNIVLEVAVEAGWLAGLALLAYVIWSIARLVKRSGTPVGAVLLGVALFFVGNALVSCDINGNRAMFISLALAWVSARAASSGPAAADHRGTDRWTRARCGTPA